LCFRINGELLNANWPTGLSVKNLIIQNRLSAVCLEKLCGISCSVESLVLESVPAEQTYTLLEKLGRGISKLEICDTMRYDALHETVFSDKLNLYQVLAACPNANSVLVNTRRAFDTKPTYGLTPKHFENLKRLVDIFNYSKIYIFNVIIFQFNLQEVFHSKSKGNSQHL